MRVVMTLCLRNEADIIDAQLAFHFGAGVDFVIATDTGSDDGTLAILERYERAGRLELRHDTTRPFEQGSLTTAMARRAAIEHGADWVVNADADEFWWPRGRNLKEVLEVVPQRYGVVYGIWRPFVPFAGEEAPFWERMTVRLAPTHAINDPTSKFRPNVNVAHRGHAGIRIAAGGHGVDDAPFAALRGWYPLEVLHFPIRSAGQMTRKFDRVHDNLSRDRIAYLRRASIAEESGAPGGAFAEYVVDEAGLEDGLQAGVLVEDVRLRNVLRELRAADGGFATPDGAGAEIELPPPTVVDDALFAADVATVGEADVVRVQRRLDALELRLRSVERNPAIRLTRMARAAARWAKVRVRKS